MQLMSKKTLNHLASQGYEGTSEAPSDWAKKMMEKYGWEEGKGLGKRGEGMKTHIAIKKKDDVLGLGADKKVDHDALWWAKKYNAGLQTIGGTAENSDGSDGAASSDSDSDSDSGEDADIRNKLDGTKTTGMMFGDVSDEALFKATGGVRLGMRARADQDGKMKRLQDADAAFLAKYAPKAEAEASKTAETNKKCAEKGNEKKKNRKTEASQKQDADKDSKRKREAPPCGDTSASTGVVAGLKLADNQFARHMKKLSSTCPPATPRRSPRLLSNANVKLGEIPALPLADANLSTTLDKPHKKKKNKKS